MVNRKVNYLVAIVVGFVALIILGVGISSRLSEKNEIILELKKHSTQLEYAVSSTQAEMEVALNKNILLIKGLTQINTDLMHETTEHLQIQITALNYQVSQLEKTLKIDIETHTKHLKALKLEETIFEKQQDVHIETLETQLQKLTKDIITLKQQKILIKPLDKTAPVNVKQTE